MGTSQQMRIKMLRKTSHERWKKPPAPGQVEGQWRTCSARGEPARSPAMSVPAVEARDFLMLMSLQALPI
jgi:hypothetical protein